MALSKLSSRKLAGRNEGARIGSTAGFACGSGSLGPTWGWVSPEGAGGGSDLFFFAFCLLDRTK